MSVQVQRTPLQRLDAIVCRVEEQKGRLGRNGTATVRAVERHYRSAVAVAVRLEDEHGVESEAARTYDDTLRTLRDRAIDIGLLSRLGCAELEGKAIGDVEREEASDRGRRSYT